MTALVTVSGHVVLSSDVWRSRLYKDSKADCKSRKYHQSTSGYIFNSKKVRYIRNQI